MKRVVITGMGVIAPIGIGIESFWNGLREGRSAFREITSFDAKEFPIKVVGEISNFNPDAHGITLFEQRNLDRYAQLGAVAMAEAVKISRLDLGKEDLTRIGVCTGSAIGGTLFMEKEWFFTSVGGQEIVNAGDYSPWLYNAATPHLLTAYLTSKYGCEGPGMSISTGCTTGIDVIGHAFEEIRNGRADIMLAGAAEAPITPITVAAFTKIGALSKWKGDPLQASRPFERDRSGFVLAEGAGMLVLEEAEHAIQRGATIYGEIAGGGSVSNAYHMTGLPSEGEDVARAILLACEDAGIDCSDIDYIGAHGSSTPQNDKNETNAFKKVFGKRAYNIPISSVKSIIGHPLGAAGSLGVIACVLMMKNSFITPTINYENPCPDCDLDYVPRTGRRKVLNNILCSASGFSGIHSSLIIRKYS
jgi:3-oxoacyl-(acyl-carrier-protein) synthase